MTEYKIDKNGLFLSLIGAFFVLMGAIVKGNNLISVILIIIGVCFLFYWHWKYLVYNSSKKRRR